MNTSIIILGSNIDPQKNIRLAKRLISEQFPVLSESRFRKTKPVGMMDQPDFINGALLVETELERELFRSELKKIEHTMGRMKTKAKNHGPRIIDIDLLVWNDQVVNQDFSEREFVREFVLELGGKQPHAL